MSVMHTFNGLTLLGVVIAAALVLWRQINRHTDGGES